MFSAVCFFFAMAVLFLLAWRHCFTRRLIYSRELLVFLCKSLPDQRFLLKPRLFTCVTSQPGAREAFEQSYQCKWWSHLLLCLVSGYVKSVKVHLITATWTKPRMTTTPKLGGAEGLALFLLASLFTRAAATRSVGIKLYWREPLYIRGRVLNRPPIGQARYVGRSRLLCFSPKESNYIVCRKVFDTRPIKPRKRCAERSNSHSRWFRVGDDHNFIGLFWKQYSHYSGSVDYYLIKILVKVKTHHLWCINCSLIGLYWGVSSLPL